mgnify:CR=1 FL=1
MDDKGGLKSLFISPEKSQNNALQAAVLVIKVCLAISLTDTKMDQLPKNQVHSSCPITEDICEFHITLDMHGAMLFLYAPTHTIASPINLEGDNFWVRRKSDCSTLRTITSEGNTFANVTG